MDFYLIIIVIVFVVCHLASHETTTLVHCGAKREIILFRFIWSRKNVDIIFVFVEGKPQFRGKERFSWVPKPEFNLLSRDTLALLNATAYKEGR